MVGISESIPVEAQVSERFTEINKFFQNLFTDFLNGLPTFLFAVVVLILGIIASKICLKIINKGMKKSNMDLTAKNFLTSLVKIAIYILLITIVLNILGVPMTSIIAVIGTAGVAVGLALKDSLGNLAGGILILVSKPFKIGDYIETNSAEGSVEQINIWYTKLVTADNKVVFIPNGQVTSDKITNFTSKDSRRVDCVFPLSYDSDFEKAKIIIYDVIDKCKLVIRDNKDLQPVVRIAAQNASSMDISVRVWSKTDDYWTVYFELIQRVRDAFVKNNLKIPFNQLDVHIVPNDK